MPENDTDNFRGGAGRAPGPDHDRNAPRYVTVGDGTAGGGVDGSGHTHAHPRSTAKIFGHPIHPMLIPFPIAFFIGAFVTDIIYARSANLIWQYFSIWLIVAGLIMGGLAALTGFIDYFGDKRVRAARPATPHMLLNVAAMLLSILNAFVHSRDGWTAVVPDGLILSGIVVLILAVSAWLGGSLTYRHAVGVAK